MIILRETDPKNINASPRPFFSGQGFIKKYDEKAYDIFKTILEEGALEAILPPSGSGGCSTP